MQIPVAAEPPAFAHVQVTPRVKELWCLRCKKPIAHSPTVAMLAIAARAHVCKPQNQSATLKRA